ncbi:MAG: hypothetical protein OXU61_01105, partial [Gammaproteobacteria bacterium]|nr:hypothetical protein [Gammaproteobacteria bacterium]
MRMCAFRALFALDSGFRRNDERGERRNDEGARRNDRKKQSVQKPYGSLCKNPYGHPANKAYSATPMPP